MIFIPEYLPMLFLRHTHSDRIVFHLLTLACWCLLALRVTPCLAQTDYVDSFYMVKDILPGNSGSYPASDLALGKILLFHADDGIHGNMLWRSDGTADGTFLLMGATADYDRIGVIGSVRGFAFLEAVKGFASKSLWACDGTTESLKEIFSFATIAQSSFSLKCLTYHNTFYFWTSDKTLWKTDGVTPVQKVFQGGISFLGQMAAGSGNIYTVDSSYYNIVMADGVLPNPIKVTYQGGAQVNDAVNIVTVGEKVLMWNMAHDLYLLNGASAQLVLTSGFSRFPTYNVDLQGNYYFIVTNSATGEYHLWKSDGTPQGTGIFMKIASPALSLTGPTTLVVGNAFYFLAKGDVNRLDFWKSDGTAAGTSRFYSRSGSFISNYFTPAGNRFFFHVDNSSYPTGIWTCDGTAAGTKPVDGPSPGWTFSDVSYVKYADGHLFFRGLRYISGIPNQNSELWALRLPANAAHGWNRYE